MNVFLDMVNKLGGKKICEIDESKIAQYAKDPISKETLWIPCAIGGTNYKSHTLIETDGVLEYKFSILGIFIISFVAIIFGLSGVDQFNEFYKQGWSLDNKPEILHQTFLILIFIGGFAWTVRSGFIGLTRKKVFDKTIGYFYVGKMPAFMESDGKNIIPLNQIHALQIISEWVPGKSSYTSYELNIVLKDATRINIVDHNNIKQIRLDAEKIGIFLGVPVWDITL